MQISFNLLYNGDMEKIYHKSKFCEKTLEIFNTCVHKFIIPLLIYKKVFHIIGVDKNYFDR